MPPKIESKFFAFYQPKNKPDILLNCREQLVTKYDVSAGNLKAERLTGILTRGDNAFTIKDTPLHQYTTSQYTPETFEESIIICKMTNVAEMFTQNNSESKRLNNLLKDFVNRGTENASTVNSNPTNLLNLHDNYTSVDTCDNTLDNTLDNTDQWSERSVTTIHNIFRFNNANIFTGLQQTKRNEPKTTSTDKYNYILAEHLVIPLDEIMKFYNVKIGQNIEEQLAYYTQCNMLTPEFKALLQIYYTIIQKEYITEGHDFSTFPVQFLKKYINLLDPENFQDELNSIWDLFKMSYQSKIYDAFADYNRLDISGFTFKYKFGIDYDFNFRCSLMRTLYYTSNVFTDLTPLDAAPIKAIIQCNETALDNNKLRQASLYQNYQICLLKLDNVKKIVLHTKTDKNVKNVIECQNALDEISAKLQILDESFTTHIAYNSYTAYHLNFSKNDIQYEALIYAGYILSNCDKFINEIHFNVFDDSFTLNINSGHEKFKLYLNNSFVERVLRKEITCDIFCLKFLLNMKQSLKYPDTFKQLEYNFVYNKENYVDTYLALESKFKSKSIQLKVSKLNEHIKATCNIDLFPYQKSNLLWMMHIEELVNNRQLTVKSFVNNIKPNTQHQTVPNDIKTFLTNMKNYNNYLIDNRYYIKHLNNEYVIDFNKNIDIEHYGSLINSICYGYITNRHAHNINYSNESVIIDGFVPVKDYWNKYTKNVELCGGILSDTVGLGKTASLICHITNSLKRDKIAYEKYKQKMGTFLADTGNGVDSDTNMHVEFEDPLFARGFEYNNLIIVPSRITSQWEQEIAKYLETKFKLRVKVLVSISNIKSLEKELRDFNKKLEERKVTLNKADKTVQAKAERAAKAKLARQKKAAIAAVADAIATSVVEPVEPATGVEPVKQKRGRKPKLLKSEIAPKQAQLTSLEALMNTDLGDDKLLMDAGSVTNIHKQPEQQEQSEGPEQPEGPEGQSYDLEQLYDVYIVSINLLSNENYIAHIGLNEGDHLISDAKIDALATEYMNTIVMNKLLVENSDTEKPNEKSSDKPNYNAQKESAKSMYRLDAIRKQITKPWQICRDMDRFNILKIKWNRITIDEVPEKLQPPIKLIHSARHNHLYKYDDQYLYECLVNLNSNFKWGLSGTPLEAGCRSLAGIIQFLSKKSPLDTKKEQIYKTRYLTDIIGIQSDDMKSLIGKIIKQTTKKEVKDIINIPLFTEDIIFVDQTNIERNIYNSIRCSTHFNDDTKRKRLFLMCTNILINDGYDLKTTNEIDSDNMLTLEELNANMISKFKTQLNIAEIDCKRIESYQTKLITESAHLTVIVKHISEELPQLLTLLDKLAKDIDNRMGLFESRSSHSELCRIYLSIIQIYELWTNPSNIGHSLFGYLDMIKGSISLSNQVSKQWETPDALTYCALYGAQFGIFHNKVDINKNIKKLDTNKTEQKRLNNQIALFKDNEFLKEKTSDPCIICFEPLNEIVITPCRHIFCKECCNRLSNSFKSGFNCPECRSPIVLKDLNMTNIDYINDPNKKKPVNGDGNGDGNGNGEGKDKTMEETVGKLVITPILRALGINWKNKCINKYGSKMAMLVEYLYKLFENVENRVIIFSQYDKMLKMIGITLEEFEIKFVYCHGNNYVLNRNINKFKKDNSIRVIMLSSESSNSGSNLTEANHIIFIDVLFQDKQHVQAVEVQAIGRSVRLGQKKSVKVVRFITRGTVEEEHFIKNRYDMNILQE